MLKPWRMRLYDSSIVAWPDRGAALVIGNCDGVHRGHRLLVDTAKAAGGRAGLLTFDPHPRQMFSAGAPFLITPPAVKLDLLRAAGLDFVCTLPFDAAFAGLGADDFIDVILRQGLAPARIVVGEGFRFGRGRQGDTASFAAAGLPVTAVPPLRDRAGAISSTRIRAALQAGDMAAANALLGWDWHIEGVVRHGDKRGRTLGYPTANVPLGETLRPDYGIYAMRVLIGDEEEWRPAVANIGIRPMFETKDALVEAFLFDFDRDLYGQTLQLQPVKRLRGEAKFDSLDALIVQMREDERQARTLLAAHP